LIAVTPTTYRAIRKSLGLTQAELGAALGLTCRAVQAHEGGEREISPPVARLLLAIQRDATLLDYLRAA